jgi:hypothetical protein
VIGDFLMKIYYLIFFTAALLIFSQASYGEIYQYTDSDGVVRFTDNASTIPEKTQKDDIKTMESVKKPYSYSFEEEVEESLSETDMKNDTWAGQVRNSADELDAEREELLQEYKDIQAAKKALGDPPSERAKSKVRADYTYQATELDRRIKEYQKRYDEFGEKVKEFNSQLGTK